MAGKRSRIPKYGTVEIKGHTYYRTTITDSEENSVPSMPKHARNFMTRNWTRCHRWMMTDSAGNRLRWRTIAKNGW